METQSSLDLILNEADAETLAIETDYRPIINSWRRAIVANAFSGQGISDAEARELAQPEVAALAENIRRYLPLNDIAKIDEALKEFESGLSKRISARQTEMREQGSFANQIKKGIELQLFRPFAFGAAEISSLDVLCTDGDKIVSVDFDQIVVSRDGIQRVITRRDLVEATRPANSSYESWRKTGGFTSESRIKERQEIAEKAAYAAAHPRSGTGLTSEGGRFADFADMGGNDNGN